MLFLEQWRPRRPGEATADAVDVRLHVERLDPRTRRRRLHVAPFAALPDGAFVLRDDEPYVVLGPSLRLWTPRGYATRIARPVRGTATVVTPPSLVEHLRDRSASALPLLHPSATG